MRNTVMMVVCAGLFGACVLQAADLSVNDLSISNEVKQSTSTATGDRASAFGVGNTASGGRAQAEGSGTTASGFASHSEGSATVAYGTASHAEGQNTAANAVGSHAGGYFAKVLSAHTNAFIHATGTDAAHMAETVYANTAHFDRIILLKTENDDDDSVLSRSAIDTRISTALSSVQPQGDLSMGTFTSQ